MRCKDDQCFVVKEIAEKPVPVDFKLFEGKSTSMVLRCTVASCGEHAIEVPNNFPFNDACRCAAHLGQRKKKVIDSGQKRITFMVDRSLHSNLAKQASDRAISVNTLASQIFHEGAKEFKEKYQ